MRMSPRAIRMGFLVAVLGLGLAACKGKSGDKKTEGGDTGGKEPAAGEGEKPAAGGEYKELDSVPNAGSIKGTITYTGSKQPEKLNVTKDPQVCKHGGEPDPNIVVKDGKLKNAVIAITDDIKEGKKWSSNTAVVNNHECLFDPHVQVAKYKGEIEAKNSDPILHNTNLGLVDGANTKTLANIALPKQGESQTKDLKKAGIVAVKCDVHEWMHAWVWVSKHPYVAVSGDDGSYTIDGVPPGEYNVKIWHEVFGEKDAKVKVDAGGAATLDQAFN
jgi:hypothetical protein